MMLKAIVTAVMMSGCAIEQASIDDVVATERELLGNDDPEVPPPVTCSWFRAYNTHSDSFPCASVTAVQSFAALTGAPNMVCPPEPNCYEPVMCFGGNVTAWVTKRTPAVPAGAPGARGMVEFSTGRVMDFDWSYGSTNQLRFEVQRSKYKTTQAQFGKTQTWIACVNYIGG